MVRPSQDALLVRHIGVIPLGLFAHRSYLEKHGMPKRIEDLGAHRLIGFDRQTAFIRAMMKRYPFFEDISFAFKSDHSIALLNALRSGMGIGFAQVPAAARDTGLVRLLPELEVTLDTWVAMHENLKSSPRCRATFDALVEGLRRYLA
jgi:DNA-binding transcriptional LysR family regulator